MWEDDDEMEGGEKKFQRKLKVCSYSVVLNFRPLKIYTHTRIRYNERVMYRLPAFEKCITIEIDFPGIKQPTPAAAHDRPIETGENRKENLNPVCSTAATTFDIASAAFSTPVEYVPRGFGCPCRWRWTRSRASCSFSPT